MSELKVGKIQSGISVTAANNMVLDASADDGTFTFKREDGSVLFTVDATGKIDMDGTGIFQKDNILGTVSQVGGIPTGAVIEYGSNANGSYTRFADGTQICTTVEFGYSAGVLVSKNLPITFSDATPETFATIFPNHHYEYQWSSFSTSGVANFISTAAGLGNTVALTAIGRWF